ncbi:T9SS type A sorting domain-containing protein [Taibaiella chishuiensis]|uniref:Putative secreted protein (Por secretion system target) n=1 Tax=Taibaiella chishuiensis TaxID=1434707 RepID=A0A2P8D4A4_9BACT|nr:T9SS type A sorting domain-containing protein [Taibaiella chishuiensis]PSK92058.1 putative secreted protein (Por secretion system target) [Taibaiella chishuiensis]
MKRILCALSTLLITALMATGANAQTTPYNYSYSNAPYVNLDNSSTLILGNTGWDDTLVHFSLPAGFNFKYQGAAVTDWALDTYGGLYPNGYDTSLHNPAIIGIQSDYADNGQSRISYAVSGAAGSRIAKIEFRNMGFFEAAPTDTANFQVWLYEGTSKIEYHAGPSHTSPGMFNPANDGNQVATGLMYAVENMIDAATVHMIRYRNGANTDTTIFLEDAYPNEQETMLMLYDTAIYPVNGAVFAFTPKTGGTAIQTIATRIGSVSPNPATDRITLQLKSAPAADAAVTIYSVTGRQVLHQKITATRTDIPLEGLTKGIYLLAYTADGKRETLRVVKK